MYYDLRVVDMSNLLIVRQASLGTPSDVALWVGENLPAKVGYELRIYVGNVESE